MQFDAEYVGCQCEDCVGIPAEGEASETGRGIIIFDESGPHVDGCDLPRCFVCADTLGLMPWWEVLKEGK